MGEWMDTMDGNKYLFEKRVGGGVTIWFRSADGYGMGTSLLGDYHIATPHNAVQSKYKLGVRRCRNPAV